MPQVSSIFNTTAGRYWIRDTSKQFHATIKTDIQTLRQITSGRMIEDPNQEYVFTGIEHLAAKILVHKTVEYRIAHKDAILGEYRRQEASGIVDLKRLRNASNSFSKIGKAKALILAGNTEDAQEWFVILRSTHFTKKKFYLIY